MSLRLDIQGVGAEIDSEEGSVLEAARHDFGYFVSDRRSGEEPFRIRVARAPRGKPGWRRSLVIGDTVFFSAGRGVRRVLFFRKAWTEYAYTERRCAIFCDDPEIAYETCHLVLLSYVGERLDAIGRHRIHGLGLSWEKGGAILLGPSGAGKSTLALRAISAEGFRLLADDVPLVERSARMLAFPLRIATRERPDLPPRQVRRFRRVRYGEKFVVGAEHFAHRIQPQARVDWLILMDKDARARCEPVSRLALVIPLIRWLVVGHETPQIWQLFLRPEAPDLARKLGILLSRVRVALDLLLRSRPARFYLAPDPENSFAALSQWLGAEATLP